ncbi:MAG TPA: hypothetical protein DCM08_04495 [Microscillaceae bacterium]|nr:hypothetical protein [Microscillaceae bacterium]
MKKIKQLAVYLRNRFEKKRFKSFVRQNHQLTKQAHIGILYQIDPQTNYDAIADWMSKFWKEKIKCTLLGYQQGKLSDSPLPSDVFTIQDFNWKGLPTTTSIELFLNTPFDYLFCLCPKPEQGVYYVLLRNKAKFRIGYYDRSHTDFLDLMFHLPEGAGIEEFLALVDRFVSIEEVEKTTQVAPAKTKTRTAKAPTNHKPKAKSVKATTTLQAEVEPVATTKHTEKKVSKRKQTKSWQTNLVEQA